MASLRGEKKRERRERRVRARERKRGFSWVTAACFSPAKTQRRTKKRTFLKGAAGLFLRFDRLFLSITRSRFVSSCVKLREKGSGQENRVRRKRKRPKKQGRERTKTHLDRRHRSGDGDDSGNGDGRCGEAATAASPSRRSSCGGSEGAVEAHGRGRLFYSKREQTARVEGEQEEEEEETLLFFEKRKNDVSASVSFFSLFFSLVRRRPRKAWQPTLSTPSASSARRSWSSTMPRRRRGSR